MPSQSAITLRSRSSPSVFLINKAVSFFKHRTPRMFPIERNNKLVPECPQPTTKIRRMLLLLLLVREAVNPLLIHPAPVFRPCSCHAAEAAALLFVIGVTAVSVGGKMAR